MTCSRCSSLMIACSPLTFYGSDARLVESDDSEAHRCPICGDYVDAVVLRNRAIQAQERRLVNEANAIATWAEFNQSKPMVA